MILRPTNALTFIYNRDYMIGLILPIFTGRKGFPMRDIKLVATDLDGTFLRNDRSISPANLKALHKLGERQVIRVAATGRNLKKVMDVIGPDVPFDYIVFSSGAGVYNWKAKEHIYSQNITDSSAAKLLNYFIEQQLNFHAFYPVPDNHLHFYFRGAEPCEEFERYFEFNKAHATELEVDTLPNGELCQFLVILKEDELKFLDLKSKIEALCPEIRVIRASSPLTKGYIWLEVFHRKVSKGNGVFEVCRRHDIDPKHTLGIGNDYNDFDMLEMTQHSFLTKNAPLEIKHRYPLAPSNEEDAFAELVKPLLK